jgi:hypothetical protein
VVSFTLLTFTSKEKSRWYTLEAERAQSRSGHCGGKKNLLPLSGMEHQFLGCPAQWLSTCLADYQLEGRNIVPNVLDIL